MSRFLYEILKVCPGIFAKLSWKVLECPGILCKKNSGQHVSTFQTLVQYISKFSSTMVDN